MDKIKKMSRFLSWIFLIASIIYPINELLYACFYPNRLFHPTMQVLFSAIQDTHAPIILNVAIYAFFCMTACLTIGILYQLSVLFRLYSQGVLFEAENIERIKFIGIFMVAKELLQFVSEPVITAMFTYYNIAGWRTISMSFESSQFNTLMTGLVILTASWIMSEAHRLKEEELHTV